MARIHPDDYPDRFALMHYAQRMRREETYRLFRAIADRVRLLAAPAPAVTTRHPWLAV
ncbi:MAG: hypothetical protein U1F58_15320 [Burkholderiales bacterium]